MDNTELMAHCTAITEHVRAFVEQQYPGVEITGIHVDATVHYRLRGPYDTDPVAGRVRFQVEAVEAPHVPMQQYRIKRHTLSVEVAPEGLRIAEVRTRE